jgi:broad specificity phosphatase PhoE
MPASVIGTTVILIRHGEREEPRPTNNDPHLSPAGQLRARTLVRVLGQAKISAIYTSEFIRTNEMAQPLATRLGLSPIKLAQLLDIKDSILSNQAGKRVLVIGHSDTVPELIKLLGGGGSHEIADPQFDNMFFVTILDIDKATVTRLKYGEKT